MENRIIKLNDGTHIHYDDLLRKIATYLYVTTSSETTTNNWTTYVDEIENDLDLPIGLIDQKMCEDIKNTLYSSFEEQIADIDVVFKEGDDEHTEVDRYFDITLYDDYCVGFVQDDQSIVENQRI